MKQMKIDIMDVMDNCSISETSAGIGKMIANELHDKASKFCERFESDADLDIKWIDEHLREADKETKSFFYAVAFRDCGTDHPHFIACRSNMQNVKAYYRHFVVFEAHRIADGMWEQTLRTVSAEQLWEFMWRHFEDMMKEFDCKRDLVKQLEVVKPPKVGFGA